MTPRQQNILKILEDFLSVKDSDKILMTYTELCEIYEKRHGEKIPPFAKWFHDDLGKVSKHTLSNNGFAITAVVVNSEKLFPGYDFFPIFSGTTNPRLIATIWTAELSKIVAFYK